MHGREARDATVIVPIVDGVKGYAFRISLKKGKRKFLKNSQCKIGHDTLSRNVSGARVSQRYP